MSLTRTGSLAAALAAIGCATGDEGDGFTLPGLRSDAAPPAASASSETPPVLGAVVPAGTSGAPSAGSGCARFCPDTRGPACCMPDGKCGFDFGMGCVESRADAGPGAGGAPDATPNDASGGATADAGDAKLDVSMDAPIDASVDPDARPFDASVVDVSVEADGALVDVATDGATDTPPPLGGPAKMGFKVAFLADTGVSQRAKDALALVVSEGADFAIHLGDFDYGNDPAAWAKLMGDGLGTLPWFAVVGNHDVAQWSGYQAVIQTKLSTIAGASCVGEVGVKQSCVFQGIEIALSGIGLLGTDHETFLDQELGASTRIWRMCGWHLNQHDFQLGYKVDETGYGVHQACAAHGALIVNGHEHSYARTRTLTDVANEAVGHGASGAFDLMELAAGKTYVTVNGTGGESLRVYDAGLHDDDTWWSSGYTQDVTIDDGVRTSSPSNYLDAAGVAFLVFGVDGDPKKASGYYKTIGGQIRDQWSVVIDTTGL